MNAYAVCELGSHKHMHLSYTLFRFSVPQNPSSRHHTKPSLTHGFFSCLLVDKEVRCDIFTSGVLKKAYIQSCVVNRQIFSDAAKEWLERCGIGNLLLLLVGWFVFAPRDSEEIRGATPIFLVRS